LQALAAQIVCLSFRLERAHISCVVREEKP
jgi:hypothetical protein